MSRWAILSFPLSSFKHFIYQWIIYGFLSFCSHNVSLSLRCCYCCCGGSSIRRYIMRFHEWGKINKKKTEKMERVNKVFISNYSHVYDMIIFLVYFTYTRQIWLRELQFNQQIFYRLIFIGFEKEKPPEHSSIKCCCWGSNRVCLKITCFTFRFQTYTPFVIHQ